MENGANGSPTATADKYEEDLEIRIKDDTAELAELDRSIEKVRANRIAVQRRISANHAALSTYRRQSQPVPEPEEQKRLVTDAIAKLADGEDVGVEVAAIAEETRLSSGHVSNVCRFLVEKGVLAKVQRGCFKFVHRGRVAAPASETSEAPASA